MDWCAGHALPESMCTVCNPELIEGFRAAGDWCAGHGFPESACPFCHPVPPPPGFAAEGAPSPETRVQLRTPALERAAGIETVPAASVAIGAGVATTARIDFDRNTMADVRSPVPGIVREVLVDLGRQVAAGETLFTLESARVGDLQAHRGAARARVRTAGAHLARQKELHAGAIVPQRQVELARQELGAARAEVRSIDQSLLISGAARDGRTGAFAVTAPLAGTVIRRPALVGTFAGESDSLATVADTTAMWAVLDISEWEASAVRAGQPVEVVVDALPGRTFTGTVTWVAAEVDARTRTVAARAELPNPDGLLRAGQFARATIRLEPPQGATAVPIAAIQRVGDESVVFVRVEEGVFEPRTVIPGRSDGRRVQVEGALVPGDAVVTTGAFLLRTELARGSIGAGCCTVREPGGE